MNGDPDHQDVYVSSLTHTTPQNTAAPVQPFQNQPVYTPLATTPPTVPPQTPPVITPAQAQSPTPVVEPATTVTPASSFAPTQTPAPETAPPREQEEQSFSEPPYQYTDPNETISVPDRTPSLSEMRKNKQRTTLGIVVSVAGIILLAALGVYLDRRAGNQLVPTNSTVQNNQEETNADIGAEITRKEVVELVEGVIAITENTHYELTLQYFLYGDGERLREDDIIDSLEFMESTYKRSDDTFNILVSTDRTRLKDNNAQVLVDFVGNDIYPVRFDLEKRNDEWKITFITFGGKLNL